MRGVFKINVGLALKFSGWAA